MESDLLLAGSLTSFLSAQAIVTDENTLNRYAASINGTTCRPAAVVFPVSTDEVAQLVRWANEKRVSLFTISRGRNLGYGDAQGTASGQVIVDLSRMNKILAVDEKLGTVSIQPGVSQGQLYEHLQHQKSRLMLDVTGAGIDASVVGNMLERGFGHTEYGDRFATIIHLTAVTGEGKIIRTGFSGYPNARTANTYRYGIGPMLEGLFSQSNLGIITELTFELMPKPEVVSMFVLSSKKEDSLANIVEAVRELRLSGVVKSAVHIANRSRAVGEKDNKLVGAWNLSGAITGPASVVRSKERYIKKIFRQHASSYSLWFFGKRMLALVKWIHEHVFSLDVYAALRDIYDLQTGKPTDEPLRTLLNDDQLSSKELNPGNYSTCFSWINATIPANGEDAVTAVRLLENLFKENNYEFRITLTAETPRTLVLISNVTYPRTPDEISRAAAFTSKCSEALIAAGYLPYRSGSGMYDNLPSIPEETYSFLRSIKTATDPNSVLAPGKYRI